MKRILISTFILAWVAAFMVAGTSLAQDKFPSKPINVIVPFSAGGSTDLLARAVEKIWPKYSPQPMVIVNKPGDGGVVGTEFVVRSKPDGYTLFLGYGSGHDVVMPHLQKMPYDTLRGFLQRHAPRTAVCGRTSHISRSACHRDDREIKRPVAGQSGLLSLTFKLPAPRPLSKNNLIGEILETA